MVVANMKVAKVVLEKKVRHLTWSLGTRRRNTFKSTYDDQTSKTAERWSQTECLDVENTLGSGCRRANEATGRGGRHRDEGKP